MKILKDDGRALCIEIDVSEAKVKNRIENMKEGDTIERSTVRIRKCQKPWS